MKDYDDKDLAITCIMLLGIAGIFVFQDTMTLRDCIMVIAALATGKFRKD